MSVIDDYLHELPEPQKKELQRIRLLAKHIVPDAEETTSYGMPALKYKNHPLLYFSAFKDHLSIFPTSGPIEALGEKLAGYKVSKGTIQFTENNPLPEALLVAIIEERVSEINAKSRSI